MADMPANNRAAVRIQQCERDAPQLAMRGASPAAPRMAPKLPFATVWINTRIPLVNETPHGGYKQSGYRKDMGIFSLPEYTQIKHMMASYD